MGTQRKLAKKYHSRVNLNLQSNMWEMLPFLLIPCSRRCEVEYTNLFTVLTPWIRNTKTGCFNYPRHTISCTKWLAGSPFYFQFWRQKENHSCPFKKNWAQWLTSDTLLLCACLCMSVIHKPFNGVDLCSHMKGFHRVKYLATQQVFMWKTQTHKYIHTKVYKMI